MWVRLTFVKVHLDKLDELKKIYYAELVLAARAQRGIKDIFLLESVDEEGEVISLTAWESKEDGDRYESSGTYAGMVNKVKHTFAGPPTLKSYEVKK